MRLEWLRSARVLGLNAQWSASIICALVSLGLSVLLARVMGPATFGSYAFLLGLGATIGIALDAGFRTLLLRERAAPSAGQRSPLTSQLPALFGHLLFVLLTLGLGSLALGTGWSGLSVLLCFASITLVQWYSAWLKGSGDFHREASWQLLCRLVSAALIIIAIVLFEPVPALIFTAWALGLLLCGLGFLARTIKRPTLPGLSLYGGSLSFAAVDLATLIYHRADVVLLYAMRDDAAEVGRYAAAYRLYDGVLLLAAPLTLLLFRRIRQSPHSRFETGAMRFALGAALLLTGAAWSLGTPMAAYLFGAGFTEHHLIGWLFCALIFALPNGVLTQWAIAHHQERYYALSAALAALFNLAINAWLIPLHGALGAAWATVATEALLCGMLLVRWRFFLKNSDRISY